MVKAKQKKQRETKGNNNYYLLKEPRGGRMCGERNRLKYCRNFKKIK